MAGAESPEGGRIDSIVKRLDDRRFAQRFSPRRPGSNLSEMNRERIKRLVAAGKMTRAGLAAVGESRTAPGTRGARALRPAADIQAPLRADPVVWASYRRLPASYRRIRVGWIEGARRRPDEFRKRLRYFVTMTRKNKRFGMVQ